MKWFLIAALAAVPLILTLISLIPGAQDENEAIRDWCEVCPRWSECNGVDEECPWSCA